MFPARATPGFLALLIAAVALSGCLGDDDADAPEPASEGTDTSTGTDPGSTGSGAGGTNAEAEPTGPDEPEEQGPEAHFHPYWGVPPLPEVIIFDGTVTLTTDHCIQDNSGEGECIGAEPHVGAVEFNLEDDGDDVGPDARTPHNNGRADTVFNGASHIEAIFSWDESELGKSLLFYYKPANSPVYMPFDGGIEVTTEDPKVVIPVRAGMADPAHQFRISRWSFQLVANSGPVDPWSLPVRVGTGDVDVDMVAVNGGKDSIDPPHPDFWQDREVVNFGSVEGAFTVTSAHVENGDVAQTVYVQGDDFEGIAMPPRSIVPPGTLQLIVTATVTAADQIAENSDWGLKWHGANDQNYRLATDMEAGDAGSRVYTIPIDGFVTDPPYETESFFRFGFYPITGGQAETGTYGGSYTLEFEIHKDPAFILT